MTEGIWMETEGAPGTQSQVSGVKKSPIDEERDFIMKYSEPFRTTSDMNVVWARGLEKEPMLAYDGFANFCLEITWQ